MSQKLQGDLWIESIQVPLENNGSTNLIELAKQSSISKSPELIVKETAAKNLTKEASFPGGAEGFKRYLERNLDANVAANVGAPPGIYNVKVQFLVDKEGKINNVEAISIPKECPSCGTEAVKVIQKGPSWEPGIKDGNSVISKRIQEVTFQVAKN